MTTFMFNFSGDIYSQGHKNDEDEIKSMTDDDKKAKQQNINNVKWLECQEVTVRDQIQNLDEIATRAKMFTCGFVEIGHVLAKEALSRLGDSSLKNSVEEAENKNSDLVPGRYEGGLKIWECTHDLVSYLENAENLIQFKQKKVLDLGCGAGILGIYAMVNYDASEVTFQDYNKEVLECVTIPNVLLNIDEEDRVIEFVNDICKFYSGDWDSFNKKLPETELFDLILTSETIYNPDNYDKLLNLFLQRLAKDGVAYVAAKTYYFGVGGGTRQFEALIKNNILLNCEVCWKSCGGIQREILKITRSNNLFVID